MSDRTIRIGFTIAVLVLAMAGMVYGNTFIYPTKAYMLGVFGLIAVSCAANLAAVFRAGQNSAESDAGAGGERRPFIGEKPARAIGLVLAYAAGIPVIGFYTMSFVYFACSVILFSGKGKDEWRRALAAALALVAVMYLLFSYFLRVPAPRGLLF